MGIKKIMSKLLLKEDNKLPLKKQLQSALLPTKKFEKVYRELDKLSQQYEKARVHLEHANAYKGDYKYDVKHRANHEVSVGTVKDALETMKKLSGQLEEAYKNTMKYREQLEKGGMTIRQDQRITMEYVSPEKLKSNAKDYQYDKPDRWQAYCSEGQQITAKIEEMLQKYESARNHFDEHKDPESKSDMAKSHKEIVEFCKENEEKISKISKEDGFTEQQKALIDRTSPESMNENKKSYGYDETDIKMEATGLSNN